MSRPLSVLRRRLEQAHLAIGYRGGAPATTPTARRSTWSTTCLGGGMSSRLFDEIREQRGLAYAVYSSPSSYCRRRLA